LRENGLQKNELESHRAKEKTMAVEIMNRTEESNGTDKETLYMLGGVALVIFGAGLVLSNPTVRRYLGQVGVGNLASAALPDLERYFRLRSM
jgi:hypothetical protein